MHSKERPHWFIRYLKAIYRLVAAVGIATVAFLIQPYSILLPTRLIVSWDIGALIYLCLAWIVIVRSDAGMTRERTLSQDQSGLIIFLLVIGAACASIIAIGFMQTPVKEISFWPKTWHIALSVLALMSSWLLIQTVFAFHYARRYYGANKHMPTDESPLLFPGHRAPDYMDFAYYACVIGMTSQVSDVMAASRQMRRLTLMHGILSFVFNIAVLALSINIIASVI